MYSAKSRDPFLFFISAILSFFAVRTLRWANGHHAWPQGSWKLFWGNPPTCQLPAEDWNTPSPVPQKQGAKKPPENKPASFHH